MVAHFPRGQSAHRRLCGGHRHHRLVCARILASGPGAAVHRAKVSPGSSVLVIGTGGLGMNVIQGARIAGASTIIAADVFEEKLVRARALYFTTSCQVTLASKPLDTNCVGSIS